MGMAMEFSERENTKKSAATLARERRNARERFFKCCGLSIAILLILAIALLIIAITVFNPKNPQITILSLRLHSFSATSLPPSYTPNVKLTIALQISLHNPNYAVLHYSSGSVTSIFYHGELAGHAVIANGLIPPRATRYITSSVSFRNDLVITNPSLLTDFNSGELPVSTQTTISGRVKVLKALKRHTVASSACNISLSVRTQSLEYFICNYPMSRSH